MIIEPMQIRSLIAVSGFHRETVMSMSMSIPYASLWEVILNFECGIN